MNDDQMTLTQAAERFGVSRNSLKVALQHRELVTTIAMVPNSTLRRDGTCGVTPTNVVTEAAMRAYLAGETRLRRGETIAQTKRAIALPILIDALHRGLPMLEACRIADIPRTTVTFLLRMRPEEMQGVKEAQQAGAALRARSAGLLPKTKGIVYIIGANAPDGCVKVGFTTRHPEKRMLQLQTGSPVVLLVLASVRAPAAFELWLHAMLRPDHSHCEWFHRSGRLNRIMSLMRSRVDPMTEAGRADYHAACQSNPLFAQAV